MYFFYVLQTIYQTGRSFDGSNFHCGGVKRRQTLNSNRYKHTNNQTIHSGDYMLHYGQYTSGLLSHNKALFSCTYVDYLLGRVNTCL